MQTSTRFQLNRVFSFGALMLMFLWVSNAAAAIETKLTASDAAANDEFGRSVSISGDYAIVGSALDDDAGDDSGSAYVFGLNNPVLYRGVVPGLTTGWKASALPLTEANDDPSLPFPVTTELGGRELDGLSTVAPLVLYRLLFRGALDSGNVLRAVKSSTFPGAVELLF
jgi:hypothetical protein